MLGRIMRGMTAGVAGALVLVGAASAGAAVRHVAMDKFRPSYNGLPNGNYTTATPYELGASVPSGTFSTYGGCARLKFPAGTRITGIWFEASGTAGWSYAAFKEHRYGEPESILNFSTQNFPGDVGERTLVPPSATGYSLKPGYDYYLCVQGDPGTASLTHNEFRGFKVRFSRP